jgi:senataxin
MNVALTRARSSLFILGNVATLQRSDENWKTIIANARSRSHLADVSMNLP